MPVDNRGQMYEVGYEGELGPGPDQQAGAQDGFGPDRMRAGLLNHGFIYGSGKQIRPGQQNVEVCRIQGDDPATSVQVTIRQNAVTDGDLPRARILIEYGTGQTTRIVEVVGDQSVTLPCSTAIVRASLEGTSIIPVDVMAFFSYGSTSCNRGARWRSELFTVLAHNNLDFDIPGSYEAAIFCTDRSIATATVDQYLTTLITLKQTVNIGEAFKVLPGCRRINVGNASIADAGYAVSCELIL